VSYQNHSIDIHNGLFGSCVVCDINDFQIQDFLFIVLILAFNGGQQFCYDIQYPCNTWITEYAEQKIVNTLLMFIVMMG